MALVKLLPMGCTDLSLIPRTTWRPCAMRSASGRMQRGVPLPDRRIASARRNSTFQKTLSKRSRFCSRSDPPGSAQLACRGGHLARWFWRLAKTDLPCVSKGRRCGIQRKVRDHEEALTNTRASCVLSRHCCVHVRENLKYLVKPRDFENRAHRFLQASQREFTAVGFNLLHCFDKCRQSSAVDVSDMGQIDHESFRLFLDHCVKGRRDGGRNVKIDLAFERQHIGTVFARHWGAGRGEFFHSTLQSSMNHHPSVSIMPSTLERSSIRKSG